MQFLTRTNNAVANFAESKPEKTHFISHTMHETSLSCVRTRTHVSSLACEHLHVPRTSRGRERGCERARTQGHGCVRAGWLLLVCWGHNTPGPFTHGTPQHTPPEAVTGATYCEYRRESERLQTCSRGFGCVRDCCTSTLQRVSERAYKAQTSSSHRNIRTAFTSRAFFQTKESREFSMFFPQVRHPASNNFPFFVFHALLWL